MVLATQEHHNLNLILKLNLSLTFLAHFSPSHHTSSHVTLHVTPLSHIVTSHFLLSLSHSLPSLSHALSYYITRHDSYTCILRYLSATHQVHQKCPLCADHFSRSGLKPVKFNTMVVPNLAVSTGSGGGGGGGGGGREFEKRKHRDREKEKERNGDRERERDRERRGSELEEGEGEGEGERELKGDSYTLQLLFVEKDSLFPTLPLVKYKKNDVNSSSSSGSSGGAGNEGNKNQKNNMKSKKSSPPSHVPIPSFCPPLHRPVSSVATLSECSLVPLNTEARGRFSRIVTVSIEGCLVAMEEERSMLLAYRQECLDSGCGTGSVYDEASFNLTDTNTATGIATGTGSASASQGQGQGHVEEGSSSSSAVGVRSRSNSCWGSPHTVSAAAADTLLSKMIHMQQQQQLQQQQRNLERLHLQGDTEYLPAINEALMLLLEKEQAFRDKCSKLGIQAVLTSSSFQNIREAEANMEQELLDNRNSVNPDVMKEIVIDKRKERDKDREKDHHKGKKIDKDKVKDKDNDRHIASATVSEMAAVIGAGTGRMTAREMESGTVTGIARGAGTEVQTEKTVDDKNKTGNKFSLSASSVPFVPSFALLSSAQPSFYSSLPPPPPLPLSASLVFPDSSTATSTSTLGLQLTSSSSTIAATVTGKETPIHPQPPPPLPPPLPLPTSDRSSSLCPVPLSSSTSQEDESNLTTVPSTLIQSTPSSSSSSSLSTKYHMFQSPHGDLIFLHPLCTKCLLASVHNDVTHLPYTVTSSVLEIEMLRVSAAMKTRIPFLRYLPDYCQVLLVELDMRGLVTAEAWNAFKEEFVRRAKKRKEKDKITKKEKKQKDDEM